MKFKCKKCEKTKDLYKVKFTAIGSDLVCKDAICCDEEMQCLTNNEGMPTIVRNEKSKDYVETLMKGNRKRE